MPALPSSLKTPVGFPTPGEGPPGDHIYITKTDWADALVHITALGDWIRVAAGCLEAR